MRGVDNSQLSLAGRFRAFSTVDSFPMVVGVNAFRKGSDESIPVLKINPHIEQEQVAALSLFRSRRDNLKVEGHLATLEKACRDPEAWLMPEILECVRVGATEGEIVRTMERVLGTWREQPVF